WKLLRGWHRCVVDQHGDNRNPPLKRIRDLQTNEVSRIVDPARSVRPFSKPMRANDRDDQIRPLNHLLDLVPKIRSRWNGIKIHEDILLPEFRLQPVIKPPGSWQRVFP